MGKVLFEKIGSSIGKIVLNDPESLNPMGQEMAAEFSTLTSTLAKEKELRVLILTGAGRAFSAGGDLAMLEAKTKLSGEENKKGMLAFYDSFLGLFSLNIPVIAALNGHAIGAGLCLACACDIRIAAEGAKLGFTFTRLGLHPGMAATYSLPRVLGIGRASELLLTGRVIDANEAEKIGLVSKVLPQSEILKASEAIAGEILECGPEATKQLTETLRAGTSSLKASLDREAKCQSVNYASAEFLEGVRATKEKRKATYQGR